MYWCAVVARNLAYMRHFTISHYVRNENISLVEIFRLEDLGFQLLPDWSHSELAKTLNELCTTGLHLSVLVFITVIPFLKRSRQRNVFAVNVLVRFSFCYATVHIFRSLTYLATSLPGPAEHCIDPLIVEKNKPKSISEAFTSANVLANCGDLLYSGHIAGYVTAFCTVVHYLNKLIKPENDENRKQCCDKGRLVLMGVTAVYTIGLIIQSICAIGTRQHYTVDIYLGILAGYWNFIWHLFVLRPTDMIVSCPIEHLQENSFKRIAKYA